MKSNDFFEKTKGWVYKNLGRRESIRATVTYVLTHHALEKGKTGYSYYGVLSYNKARTVSKMIIEEPVLCYNCGEHMERYGYVDANILIHVSFL